MTHRIQYNPYLHTAYTYLFLVEALTHDRNIKPMLKIERTEHIALPKFSPTESEKEKMRSMLKNKLGKNITRPLVLLNPNAGDMLPLRKWPTDRFVELAKKLLSHYSNITIVITGAPSEKYEADNACKEIGNPNVVCVAGDTTLKDVLTLYVIADLLVTNDSGPGHFSSMTDIKTIVMFGPETPELFGPLGANAHLIWKKLACSPCVNVFNHRFSQCNDNVCMKNISVDEVFDLVRQCLP